MYGECMCEGMHLCRALSRNFVMGGAKIKSLGANNILIQVAYQVIKFKEGQNPSNGEVDAPLCPPLNEALSVRMCRRHACMSQRRRKDFLIGGA